MNVSKEFLVMTYKVRAIPTQCPDLMYVTPTFLLTGVRTMKLFIGILLVLCTVELSPGLYYYNYRDVSSI